MQQIVDCIITTYKYILVFSKIKIKALGHFKTSTKYCLPIFFEIRNIPKVTSHNSTMYFKYSKNKIEIPRKG